MESKITVPLVSVNDESTPMMLTVAPEIGAIVCWSNTFNITLAFVSACS